MNTKGRYEPHSFRPMHFEAGNPVNLSVKPGSIKAIFIDDGGVIQDNRRRHQQWRVSLPEYMVPRYGGITEDWAEANDAVVKRHMPRIIAGTGFPLKGGFKTVQYALRVEWVRDMFEHVRIPAPSTDADCYQLDLDYTAYVLKQVRADFPGAVDAIWRLAAAGYPLFTCSGTESRDLRTILGTLGIEELFAQTYGPDLIDTHKSSPHFYEGMLANAGVEPGAALFIDDSENSIGRIVDAGATAVLVSDSPLNETKATAVLPSLADLPAYLGI